MSPQIDAIVLAAGLSTRTGERNKLLLPLAGKPLIAMSLLKSLHIKDLKGLATNRNVSAAIFTQATKLYKQKKQGSQRH